VSKSATILQVIPSLDAGGAERTTVDIARTLVRDGFRSLVATEGGRLESVLFADGSEVIRLPVNSKAPGTILANGLRLANLVRAENVNLIHARSRAPAWSALYAAHATGIPFLTTYHGIYNANNPFKRLYNSVMVRSDAIIANSEWTAAHIVREHRIPRERITVIPRGVDLAEFNPANVPPERIAAIRSRWGISEGDLVVLLPGRLTRWKGQLVFVEALEKPVCESGLGKVRAVLAGDPQGRDAYADEVKDAIARADLSDRITVADHVTDMPAAYLASDIVVSASTDPEAFGRVAAEAAAMGRPVIATDHGGARETVLANLSGFLVPPGSAAALAKAIRELIEIGTKGRAAMGQKGRAHIRERFSLERMCADTLALYCSLLSN
jgi:glycosyltransferase involved in cell wall biosynthesis